MTGLGTGVGFIAGSNYVRAKLGTPTAQGLYGGFSVGGAGLAIALVPLAALSVDWRAPYLAGLVMAAVFLVVLWAAPADDVHAGALPRQPLGDAARPAPLPARRDPHGVVRVQRHPRRLDGLALRA